MNKAIFAAGCFWGVEKLFKDHIGVTQTTVGYIGGVTSDPNYKDICTGKTGHYEAIEIEFDINKTSFEELLKFFFKLHDPTQTNGQHGDIGSQYKSAIFYFNEEQKLISQKLIQKIDSSEVFPNKIATQIIASERFYPAEQYHQNYLDKNPNGYMCHYISPTLDKIF